MSSSEEESSPLSDGRSSNKRKSVLQSTKQMKKVKYEDITDDKPLKKAKNSLLKAPTVEELNELKETENLYNNNLFRLQIEELLKEVQIKNKHRKVATNFLETFTKFLNELPKYEVELSEIKTISKHKLSKKQEFINALATNDLFKAYQSQLDFSLKFTNPDSYEIFGLDTINAHPGPTLLIKINLKMPRECFNVKDYLNSKYFIKRYYYLAYVLHHFQITFSEKIEWHFYDDNNLLPIIQVLLSNKVTIQIFATPPENYFKVSRSAADINNLKIDSNLTVPTLYYNASLGYDLTLSTNILLIKNSLMELPNAQEALKLIIIWLKQRQLDCLNDFSLYIVVYLIINKKINKHMSSYQVVRNFWNFISESSLHKNGISLDDSKADILETFHKYFDIVFLDKSGYYNIAAFLTLNLYKKLKLECGRAFQLLDYGGIDAFHFLFITRVPTELQYDLMINLKNCDCILEKMTDTERTQFLFYDNLFITTYLGKMLEKGLNKRAKIIVPLRRNGAISFGINLDTTHAFHILEMGPALNDPMEKEFREFWGDLATDRRFKDGSINVAVYIKTDTFKERREIIQTIIDWIIAKKLKQSYQLFFNQFDDFLVNHKITASYPLGSNEEASLKVTSATDELSKILRSLELPLAITGVQGISDCYTFTDVFPPISSSFTNSNKTRGSNVMLNEEKCGIVPRFVKPLEGVLHLEHSSKWPRDLTALRHMKTAFYMEMSKLLKKKHQIISSVKPNLIEILYNGFVFNFSIFLSKEVALLKKQVTSQGSTVYTETKESSQLDLKLNILPKVVSALKGIQSQFSSFGPATALIKRWLRSQMLDNYHISDDVINLLSASLYLNQSAFEVAATPQMGFLRFLKFLSEFQENLQSIVVNFNDELTKERISEVESRLLQNRTSCPLLFIAMPYDDCQSLFSRTSPSKEVLCRMKKLAGETLNYFVKMTNEEITFNVKSLFLPNLDGYNVLINLRPLLNPVRHEQITEQEGTIILKEFDAKACTQIPVYGFNPIQCYLKELRENYGEFAEFFHDSYGGNTIGVLWTPKASEILEFKVSHVNGRKLENDKLVLNKDALIEDFFILGKGIVKSIDIK